MFKGGKSYSPWQDTTLWCLIIVLIIFPISAYGGERVWSTETIDRDPGTFTSIAVDQHGNLHIAYSGAQGIMYGFRAAGDSQWYKMNIDPKHGFIRITLDGQGQPHMCFTTGSMKYAYWDGHKFIVQEIAPDTGPIGYSCGVAVAPDGTPDVTWYHEKNADLSRYLHLKYATLQNGAWFVHTVDFEMQTGKWNSLAVDSKGRPHVSYDSFILGLQKYAYFNGSKWVVAVVEAREKVHNVGLGNYLALDSNGLAHISYYDSANLKYAYQEGDHFKVQTVTPYRSLFGWRSWRTGLILDNRGFPHICYEDGGSLRHAYWDGTQWRSQLVAQASNGDLFRYSSMAFDQNNDLIYISYRDALDGSIKLATGRLIPTDKSALSSKSGPKMSTH